MNLRVPWNAGNFFTICKPVSFSRRTLHHGVCKYTRFFSIAEFSKHPVFHPGGFDVFVPQPLCLGVHLFPTFYDKTTSLFRGLSSIISFNMSVPPRRSVVYFPWNQIPERNAWNWLGMSAPCMCPFYPVFENGTSSNGMSWPMKIFCVINLQCSGTR
jgi:hypothetical protein